MTPTLAGLRAKPNALAAHYARFRVAERLLLTGHSHQAWPDAGFEGQQRAWLDAAEHVDAKWDLVAAKAERVAEGFRALMGGCDGDLALDANTHALVVRFLSALPLRERPRVVTTDGEFHSIRRQLDRLAEEGIEVVRVAADPVDTLAERAAAAVDDRTACALVSCVLFETARIVPNLSALADACARRGAELLVDAYHALGVVPFSLAGIERAFVVAGGYKYCQLGEGNCVLRVPPGCAIRPVVTGWFSEFGALADARQPDAPRPDGRTSGAPGAPRAAEVRYGRGAARFAGSTYDPTSHYRGAAVLDFQAEQGLDAAFLRDVSLHQVGLLADRFRALDLDPAVAALDDVAPDGRGGFLAIRCADASALGAALFDRGVRTDWRGPWLRFGPAPYLSDRQLEAAMEALGEVVR